MRARIGQGLLCIEEGSVGWMDGRMYKNFVSGGTRNSITIVVQLYCNAWPGLFFLSYFYAIN